MGKVFTKGLGGNEAIYEGRGDKHVGMKGLGSLLDGIIWERVEAVPQDGVSP